MGVVKLVPATIAVSRRQGEYAGQHVLRTAGGRNPTLIQPTQRRKYSPNRAEAKASPGSCS